MSVREKFEKCASFTDYAAPTANYVGQYTSPIALGLLASHLGGGKEPSTGLGILGGIGGIGANRVARLAASRAGSVTPEEISDSNSMGGILASLLLPGYGAYKDKRRQYTLYGSRSK